MHSSKMHAPQTAIEVYASDPAAGMPALVGRAIPFVKLQQLAPLIAAKMKGNSKRVVISDTKIEVKAAKVIHKWVADYDLAGDKVKQALKLSDIGDDLEFPQIVYIYATANAFGVPRGLRGDEVRDAIHQYIRSSPLRFDEFAMINEVLSFDAGLTKAARMETMAHKVNDRSPPPDMAQIEQYAAKYNFLDQLKEMEKEHEGYKQGRQRREEALACHAAWEVREAARQARRAAQQ